MNYIHDFIGTKICEKCLNHAITSYIFIHQFNFTRERLDLCVSLMLQNLSEIKPHSNVFVQVSPRTIMPPQVEIDENLLLEDEYIDETKLNVDVLEDEFRQKSESESEPEIKPVKKHKIRLCSPLPDIENPAKNATKTYANRKLMNGLQSSKYSVDVCSEFLTFNKKKKVKKFLTKFTCPLCNKHFISEYFLKRHILKHMNRKVECITCGTIFNSKFYLYEHTKMTHLLKHINYLSCKVCGRTFTSEDKLRIHGRHHRNKPCLLCDKTFASQKHYDSHIERHAVKLMLKRKRAQTCSFCEKECSNDNDLSFHVNKVHLQIKPYNCDMCERQFYTENNLKNHKKVHSLPSKETCEFCGNTLKSRKQLVIHVRKHINVKPFCCQVCGQAFYSAFKATEHMKVYHGGSFFCRICKSTFVTKSELKEHVNRDHSFI